MAQTSIPWWDVDGALSCNGRLTLTIETILEHADETNALMRSMGLVFERTVGPFGNPCWSIGRAPSNAPMMGGQTPVLEGDEPMLGGDRREKLDT